MEKAVNTESADTGQLEERSREEESARLFRRYSRPVFDFFARRGFSAEECRELTQDTFLGVDKGRERLQSDARFKSWLFAIARNVWLNQVRRRSSEMREGHEVSLDEAHDVQREVLRSEADPLAATLANERQKKLHEALRELPEQMRWCVQFRIHKGLSYREIAAIMQISIGTVKSQLLQARVRLRERLSLEFDLTFGDDTAGEQENEDGLSPLESPSAEYQSVDSDVAARLGSIEVQLSRIRSIVEIFSTGDIESAIRLIEKVKHDRAGNLTSYESLIQGVVGQLLDKGLIAEALAAWRDHRPRGVGAQAVHRRLLESLRQGWAMRNLSAFAVEPLIFHRDVLVQIATENQEYVCNMRGVEVSRKGDTPLAALNNAVKATREEASRLHGQLTHTLSEDGRDRKRVLLGLIDLPASGLVRRSVDHTWVFGYLDQDEDGELIFKSMGDGATSYNLAEPLREGLTADGRLRFARARTGKAGEPLGPVDEIEEPVEMDREAAWQEWERRTGGDVQ